MEPTNLTSGAIGPAEIPQALCKLARDAGEVVDIGSTRVGFLACSPETAGAFSLIEYAIPRALIAPTHRHAWEDGYRAVLAGRAAALLGDKVVDAAAGELIFKPRRQWHTIWNPGDEPCRILETISLGGFEHVFDELAAHIQPPTSQPAPQGELGGSHEVDTDLESVQTLCAEQGLNRPLTSVPRHVDASGSDIHPRKGGLMPGLGRLEPGPPSGQGTVPPLP